MTWEGHAGSDRSFENITLRLDQLPLEIQFRKEKRTLKTLDLSRRANTLPQCKSSCKKQAGSVKNLSVKPYSLISCKIKQTRALIALVLKLAHLLGALEQTTNSCTLIHPILRYHFPPSWIARRTKARLDGHAGT